VDSIALIGGGDLVNQPPTITSAATSSSTETTTDIDGSVWRIERGTATTLSVTASDDGGAAGLTYTWNVSGPGPVFVNPNASNSAAASAEFEQTGDYIATVTVTDAQGLAATSSVNLRVVQTASGLVVNPGVASLTVGQPGILRRAQRPVRRSDDQPAIVLRMGSLRRRNHQLQRPVHRHRRGRTLRCLRHQRRIHQFRQRHGQSHPGHHHARQPESNLRRHATRIATATTDPPGLSYQITYDDDPAAPTNVGTYAVVASITDPNYQGGDSGTLVVEKATATVLLADLTQTYDGSRRNRSPSPPRPKGWPADVTYDGSVPRHRPTSALMPSSPR
jgi:hypothetical protein